MSKRLYTGFSFFEFAQSLLLRLTALILMIYILKDYNENPGVIILVCVFLFSFILISGNDEIIIYSDRITISTNSFYELIFRTKATEYPIDELICAQSVPYSNSASETIIVTMVSSFFKKRSAVTSFYLVQKKGEPVRIETDLSQHRIIKIVALINELISAKQ